jgi:hypothetical protein
MNKKQRRANIKKSRVQSITGIDKRLYTYRETSSKFQVVGGLHNIYVMKKVNNYVQPVDYVKPTPKIKSGDVGWEPARPSNIKVRR